MVNHIMKKKFFLTFIKYQNLLRDLLKYKLNYRKIKINHYIYQKKNEMN